MLLVFDNPEYFSEKEVRAKYPNSRYILENVEDVNNVHGYLLAVSTDRESHIDLCKQRDLYLEEGRNVALLGYYGGKSIGVLRVIG